MILFCLECSFVRALARLVAYLATCGMQLSYASILPVSSAGGISYFRFCNPAAIYASIK